MFGQLYKRRCYWLLDVRELTNSERNVFLGDEPGGGGRGLQAGHNWARALVFSVSLGSFSSSSRLGLSYTSDNV